MNERDFEILVAIAILVSPVFWVIFGVIVLIVTIRNRE